MKNKSQLEWVKSQLLKKKKLTPLSALSGCGTMRLGAIIHKLRLKHNMIIKTDLIPFKTRYGFKGQYAQYSFVKYYKLK